jgi:acyl-CoA thioesterase I
LGDVVTAMRRLLCLLSIVLAALALPAIAAAAHPLKLLALGTSLTQGYGLPPGTEFTVQLQAALKAGGQDVTVVNAGVSGDTSADGLSRLDWSLADHPDAAIIELGSNDMLRGLPPAQTEINLRAILAKLKAAHIPVLLCGMYAQRNLGADYVKQFDSIYPSLAKDYNVVFYPFILEGVALNPKLNQADGMHPNPAGVKIIVARLLPYVKKMLAGVKQ